MLSPPQVNGSIGSLIGYQIASIEFLDSLSILNRDVGNHF